MILRDVIPRSRSGQDISAKLLIYKQIMRYSHFLYCLLSSFIRWSVVAPGQAHTVLLITSQHHNQHILKKPPDFLIYSGIHFNNIISTTNLNNWIGVPPCPFLSCFQKKRFGTFRNNNNWLLFMRDTAVLFYSVLISVFDHLGVV